VYLHAVIPPTHSKKCVFHEAKKHIYFEWPSVGQSNVNNCVQTKDKFSKIFYNQLLERHPFSGRCDSAGELLHTPYADSNFHGTVLLSAPHGTPFRVYRKVGADKVKPGLT